MGGFITLHYFNLLLKVSLKNNQEIAVGSNWDGPASTIFTQTPAEYPRLK